MVTEQLVFESILRDLEPRVQYSKFLLPKKLVDWKTE